MIDKTVVEVLAKQKLESSESYLVDVMVKPDNYIIVEIDNDKGVDIDECVELSRHIEAGLDRDKEDFELEVGSAGLTSPLKVVRQYLKNIGSQVEVLGRDGKKVSGVMESADEAGFTIVVSKKVKPEGAKKKIEVQEPVRYEYDQIKYCKALI